MTEQALAGVKVLDLSQYISGPYCTKLLADLGADVMKIEEPLLGDTARRTGPFFKDTPHPDGSGLFLYLNTNKRGITLNPKTPTGASIFKELVKTSDILVENTPPLTMERLGLGYESLRQTNPKLVMTSITPFGQSGPYCHYKANDLICCHMSGLGYHTPGGGVSSLEEPPLKPGGRQSDFVAGSTAAVATMFAIISRQATGVVQHLDVSQQESIAFIVNLLVPYYTYDPNGMYRQQMQSRLARLGGIGYLPCQDGYVINGSREEYQWRALLEVIFGKEWEQDERLKSIMGGQFDLPAFTQKWGTIRPMVVEWTMKHSKEGITALAQAKGVPIVPCNSAEDLFNSPQLAEREFFVEIDHPCTGKLRYPGAPYKLSETPPRVDRPAPLLGQHNEEIFCGRLGYSKQDLVAMRESGII